MYLFHYLNNRGRRVGVLGQVMSSPSVSQEGNQSVTGQWIVTIFAKTYDCCTWKKIKKFGYRGLCKSFCESFRLSPFIHLYVMIRFRSPSSCTVCLLSWFFLWSLKYRRVSFLRYTFKQLLFVRSTVRISPSVLPSEVLSCCTAQSLRDSFHTLIEMQHCSHCTSLWTFGK